VGTRRGQDVSGVFRLCSQHTISGDCEDNMGTPFMRQIGIQVRGPGNMRTNNPGEIQLQYHSSLAGRGQTVNVTGSFAWLQAPEGGQTP
jgi:hypothetical protein